MWVDFRYLLPATQQKQFFLENENLTLRLLAGNDFRNPFWRSPGAHSRQLFPLRNPTTSDVKPQEQRKGEGATDLRFLRARAWPAPKIPQTSYISGQCAGNLDVRRVIHLDV